MKLRMALLTVIFLTALAASAVAQESPKEWKMASRMYADKKARHVGDLLTVIIEESNEASKDAKSSSSKTAGLSGSASMGHPTVDANPTAWTNALIPAWKLDTSRSFEGSGSTQSKDKFTSYITVTVREVLPNGNLLIEGKRSMNIQEESVDVILTGIVRPTDITRENTIKSTSIADAGIRYESAGPIVQNQKRGIITSLWNWLNPF